MASVNGVNLTDLSFLVVKVTVTKRFRVRAALVVALIKLAGRIGRCAIVVERAPDTPET